MRCGRLIGSFLLVGMTCLPGLSGAVNNGAPPPLSTIAVPEPANLMDYVRDRAAAIRLGKALFWDMQVGSDGHLACASCHFQAGADNRTKNTLSPGILGGDDTFHVKGPNAQLTAADFPFHRLADPNDRNSVVLADANDVVSSQGAAFTIFLDVLPGSPVDLGTPQQDSVFNVAGTTVRRVEPRNTPTVINAVFNFANFWDGRANNIFNGQNPFGAADGGATILVDSNGRLVEEAVRLENSSLASQAVGPPLSDFEMSFQGRTFAKLGKKMLSLTPLANQVVHPQDSVLGALSNSRASATGRADRRGHSRVSAVPGMSTTYGEMIQAAFHPRYWENTSDAIVFDTGDATLVTDEGRTFAVDNGTRIDRRTVRRSSRRSPSPPPGTDEFTQMEANFALFFGLAIQLYESTLVSDDTPFDRFQGGDDSAMTFAQQQGLVDFLGAGKCINCHAGPELTGASVSHVTFVEPERQLPIPAQEPGVLERMAMSVGTALYDNGFYNIGVRPTAEDVGRGGSDPFGLPLSFTRLAKLEAAGNAVPALPPFNPDAFAVGFSIPVDPNERDAVDGAFKTPGLRNVELTGPYFHNGGTATLRQVVDFYVRGGDRQGPKGDDTSGFGANPSNLDPDIDTIGNLIDRPPPLVGELTEERRNNLVAFLLALTDERVRWEMAPFDHPQLLIPNGHPGDANNLTCLAGGAACDSLVELPAVGQAGRAAEGLPALQTFMGLDPFQP